MSYPVFYKSRAKSEVKCAIEWYESQRRGLGFEFLTCLEDAIAKIQNHPFLYPERHKNLRRVLLRRFPYSVFYLFEDNKIYIFSVFDNRQHPKKLP